MPELPEMEAWRRLLDDPVRAFPVEKAGPAHVATLKTFDPPLSSLEGRRLAGAERRGKRLLFPTDDDELVLLVHLMSAGRIRYLRPGREGAAEVTGVQAPLPGRRRAGPDGGRLEEAGRRLAADARAGPGGAGAPRAGGTGARGRAARRDPRRRLAAASLAAPRPAGDRRNRARLGERDPSPGEAVAIRTLDAARAGRGRAARRRDRLRVGTGPRTARARSRRQAGLPRPPQAGRAVLRLRHDHRESRLRGTHRLLLQPLPDRRARPEGPAPVAPPEVTA